MSEPSETKKTTAEKRAALRAALLPMLAPGLTGDQRVARAYTYDKPEACAFLLGLMGVTAERVGRALEGPAAREMARLMMDCEPLLDRPRMAQQVLVAAAITMAQGGAEIGDRRELEAYLAAATDPRTCAAHDASVKLMEALAEVAATASKIDAVLDEMQAGMKAAGEALAGRLKGDLDALAAEILEGIPAAPASRTVH
jgi:hypothetical protein